MVDIATLGIAVDSRQVKTAERDLQNLQRTGSRVEQQTDQITAAFRRLAGPLAAYLSGRQIAQAADQWTELSNRLKLVTDSTESFLAAQDDVFRIAQQSRQPLQATAELYQRIATNADELKLSGAGVAAVVDTINKTLAISGTSAASAQAALIQLGQAFASGALRGEELNSVLEQAPALARAIAQGMNVSVGQLRELGKAGELTARNVIDALLNQADAVEDQFGRIQKTAGQALTTLGNSFLRVVGDIDQATQASASFAEAIVSLSQYLDSGALTDEILYSMEVWRASIDATVDDIGDLQAELHALEVAGGDISRFISRAFLDLPANISTGIKVSTVEIASFLDRVANGIRTINEMQRALLTSDTVDNALQRGLERERQLQQAREDSLQQIFDQREAILGVADAERLRREQERKDREEARREREKEIEDLRRNATGVRLPEVMTKEQKKALEEAARAAKRLQEAYRGTLGTLEQQIALFNQAGEAARIRYEVERGELAKLTNDQKELLILRAEELDELERRKTLQEDLQSLIDDLRTDDEQFLDWAIENYNTLNIALKEQLITLEQYQDGVRRVGERYEELREKANKETEEMSKRWEHAMDRMQSAFADFLYDPFDQGLEGMLAKFGDILRRMAAEVAAAAVFEKIADAFGIETGSLKEGAEAVSESAMEMQLAGGSLIAGASAVKAAASAMAAANGISIGAGASGSVTGSGGSSSGGWLAAIGGIFKAIASFDGGGFTGTGPRFGGIDGKGGKLAIVHPNETIIDHAQGQTVGTTVQIGQMVFPGVVTERQARDATGAAARQLSRVASAGNRYS